MNIIYRGGKVKVRDLVNLLNPCYSEEEGFYVNFSQSSLTIIDLNNAFLRGKNCKRVSINFREKIDFLNKYEDKAIEWIFKNHNAMSEQSYESFEKGVRTFSILHLDRLKPLNKIPKKMRVGHIIRIFVNRQYESFRRDMKLTDDYAFDSANDYGKGEYAFDNAIDKVERIYNYPSGWWVNKDRNNVYGLNCHSFEYNTIILNLKKKEKIDIDRLCKIKILERER